ncbi:MAG: hypothetical protein O9302_06875 [Cyclobacteriaceae bacterium]|jgi:hypothetical protein|nr:hypothetical protein [Flammeovirgaceae bacterium]MCZ8021479.1 hypothetical protein [Cytophagales bacterium]MCZ8327763.1 hypothetical protein [Cyclobacteriaceae bacterium]
MKKALLMAVAMFLPISIFLFLKFFGKNEFVVEPLFQQNDSTSVLLCNKPITYPYKIAIQQLDTLLENNKATLTALSFSDDEDRLKDFAERVQEKFTKSEISLYQVKSDSLIPNRTSKFEIIRLDKARIEEVKSCVFLLSGLNNLVLVDREGNIRGQYQLGNLDEEDRLLVETTIILKKY